MTKFKKEDERDRSDNRYGKTELEEKQDAAELNDERRAYVSRKNVDWLQAKWEQEKQHEEDMKYQAAILKALQKSNKEDKKTTSWWEKLFGNNGLIGSFFGGGWISGLLKIAGVLGIGALIAQLMGFFGDGNTTINDLLNYVDGQNHEDRQRPDGTYVSGGTKAQVVKSGAKVVAKDFVKNGEKRGRVAIRATNAIKRGVSKLANTAPGRAVKSGLTTVKDFGKSALSKGAKVAKDFGKSALSKGGQVAKDFGKSAKIN